MPDYLVFLASSIGQCWTTVDSEVDDSGTWTIPGTRYKTGKAHTVPLSRTALDIVKAQPRTGRLVFPGRDGRALGTGSNRKTLLDAAITRANDGTPLPSWTLHDLRRTARTLMARAGVRPDVAERVVGHVIRGVEGVYDRYTYETTSGQRSKPWRG
jgi:integrase